VAVSALLALSIRDGVEEVDQARRGALLGSTWEPLIASIQAIESEQQISEDGDQTAVVDARRATDSSMSDLRQVVRRIGDSNAMVVKIGLATASLSTGRVAVDSGDDFQVIAAVRAYDTAERELIYRTLQQTRWNRREASEILGISYKALLYKIKEAELDRAS